MNGKEPLKMMEMLVIHQLSLFFFVWGEAQKKRSSHLRKSLFRISHEGHAIILSRPSVMEPIDLPFLGGKWNYNVQSENLSGT